MSITTIEESSTFIRAVGGFHDGFIKEVAIHSDDWFDWRTPSDVGHWVSGALHAEIQFAHHPTLLKNTTWPAIARCAFRQVDDIVIDSRGVQGDHWPLFDVRIQDAGNGRLSLECAWKQDEYRRLFTFASMET